MTSLQNIGEDGSTAKRKKLKIYSELNYFPRVDEYLLPHPYHYRPFSELRLEPGYYKNHNSHVKDKKTTPYNDNNIINVFLNQKLQSKSSKMNKSTPLIPNGKTTASYDKEPKHHQNGLNSLCKESRNYSGMDISRLLVFMAYTYNTMQRLLKEVKTSQMHETDSRTIILVIDAKKLEKSLNVNRPNKLIKSKKIKKQNLFGGDFNSKAEHTSVLSNNVINNAFNLTIERQCMGFTISICKYSFDVLLETLTALCNLSKHFFPVYELTKVPSLYMGNWYFRNITQGCLLRILLRKYVNVNTLNVMRQLYFVLITDTTPNLSIEINFILKHGVFMVYDVESTFSPGAVNWSHDHQRILRKSVSIDTLYMLNKLNDKQKTLNLLHAITYPKSLSRDNEMYEVTSQTDDQDDTSNFYSDTRSINLIRSDATITLAINEAVETSFIFSVAEMSCQYIELEKKSVSTLCNMELENNSESSLMVQSKLWLSKLLPGSQAIRSCFNLHDKLDYINETMFDAVPAELYVKFVHRYWKRFACQTFYKDFYKCLALTLLHTLFSSNT